MNPLLITGLSILAQVLSRELPGIIRQLEGRNQDVPEAKLLAIYDSVRELIDNLPEGVDATMLRQHLLFTRQGVAAVARERLERIPRSDV